MPTVSAEERRIRSERCSRVQPWKYRGKTTPEGKLRIAAANLRHGRYSKCPLMSIMIAVGQETRQAQEHSRKLLTVLDPEGDLAKNLRAALGD